MNQADPLKVELLASEHARRVTVESHQAFRESINPKPSGDEIDELVAELREAEGGGERTP
jgi:hypothetical protein